MKKTVVLFGCMLGLQAGYAQYPGCPNVDAGPDIDLDCTVSCTDLSATYLDIGETTAYRVDAIPFTPPAPFSGGTSVFIGIDDIFSSAYSIPFDFCFYGTPYSDVVFGTNGLITFDLTNAGGYCDWAFTGSIPDPFDIYNNSINGAFHDIDPSVSGNINFYIMGTAPCRILVLNFDAVAHFSCNTIYTTQQIVLYETTNVVEVYLQNKPTCSGWNSGNAVVGLQNATGSAGITPPGRNTGPWSASNEAWRFTPDGASTVSLTWYDDIGTVIGTTDTINVCPTDTADYLVEAVYTHCDGSTITVTDVVTVNKIASSSLTASVASQTDEDCGAANGEVTITASSGVTPYTYDIGSGPQSSGVFTGLAAGSYTVVVTDDSGCSVPVSVTIGTINTLSGVVAAVVDEDCGQGNGSFTITASGGTSPYTYDAGSGAQVSSTFTGQSTGAYTVTIIDNYGCTFDVPVNVGVIPATLDLGPDVINCEPTTITSPGPGPWLWNTGETTQEITTALGGTFWVEAGPAGCEASDTIVVTMLLDIPVYAPNVFSPNGDNTNDELVFTLFNATDYRLLITNRWGQEVFSSSDIAISWDGKTDGGKDAPEGVYFWILNYSDPCKSPAEQTVTGSVELLR